MLPPMALLRYSRVKVVGDASAQGTSSLSNIANVLGRALPSHTAVVVATYRPPIREGVLPSHTHIRKKEIVK